MYNLALLSRSILNKPKFINPSWLYLCWKAPKSTIARKNITKDEDDAPIKYMQSPASKWSAKDSRTGVVHQRLWYEPYVILGSLTVFMIYFCILREENQIDKELEHTLYSRIAGLEELQLVVSLEHEKKLGLDTTDIEARLLELRKK